MAIPVLFVSGQDAYIARPIQAADNSIASGVIVSGTIANNAVNSGNVASGSISTFHLANNAVLSGNLGSGQVWASHLASGFILPGSNITITPGLSGYLIAANTVLLSGVVQSGNIGDAAVNSGNIASGSIGRFHLASGAVNSGHIANAAVVSGSIASGSVGQFHLASGAVNSGHIGNAAVVSGSIASGSIGQFHLASGAVNSGHIGNNAVNSGNISSGAVGQVHIASGTTVIALDDSITYTAFGTISGGRFVAVNASGNLILANGLSGATPALGLIQGNTLSGQKGTIRHAGLYHHIDFNFSGSIGAALYVGLSGLPVPKILAPVSSGQFQQWMGMAIDQSGMLLIPQYSAIMQIAQ